MDEIGSPHSISANDELRDRFGGTEGALRYVSGLQRSLMEISRSFLASDPDAFDDLVRNALARVGAYCGADRSYLFRFEDGLEIHTITHEWCADGVEPAAHLLQEVRREDVPNIVASVAHRTTLRLDNINELGPEWQAEKAFLGTQDILSLIVVPVVAGNQVYGHLGFDSVREARIWNDEEAYLLEGLADVLGSTIQRDTAQQAQRESEARFRAIAEHLPGDVYQRVLEPDGRVHVPYVSPSIRRIFGIDPEQAMTDPDYILGCIHPDDREVYQSALRHSANTMKTHDIQFRLAGADGNYRWARSLAHPRLEPNGAIVWDGIAIDETERKKAEARLKEKQEEVAFLAMYDPLTGLPNRRLLMDRLRQAIVTRKRNDDANAMVFLDVDNFKSLNDTLGHDVGDFLLQQVSDRLCDCVRVSDTVARFGGDEFAVILANLGPDQAQATEQARHVAAKLLEALGKPFDLHGHERYCTVSIGITLLTGADDSVEDVLKRADLAMYKAKETGRNNLQLFDSSMRAAVQSRVDLEADLRGALARNEIVPHYQAQIDSGDRLIGAEALARWHHAERGTVPPSRFIPAAESSGLILDLGDAILRAVCEQLVRWHDNPVMHDLPVSINVSARQFHHEGFSERIEAILKETGAPAHLVCLELTESLLLEDVEDTILTMQRLRKYGIRFALDDFGTGYSSLSYLKRLPLDQLKIDQHFVSEALTDPNDAAIVRTIIVLAQSMGLDVIAEGVETEEARTLLQTYGCEAHQGYHFGHAVDAETFEASYCDTPR